jgi:hypothetical protein
MLPYLLYCFIDANTPSPSPLPAGVHYSTHLTQGAGDVIRGTCMFVVNISPDPFWIGFKRLSEESLLSLDSICREGFVDG